MKTQKNPVEVARRKATGRLSVWTLAWVLSIILATFGNELIWNNNTIITAIAILVSTLVGVGMILSNIKQYLLQDELQRKITADAMGIALGVAIVGGISYSMLDTENVIAFDAEISHLIILVGLSYLAAILIGNSRYK